MNEMILQVIMGTLGSMSVAFLFNIKKKHIFLVGIGAALTWTMYLIAENLWGFTVFEGSLFATIAVAIYAEIMAVVAKAPATVFLTISALPLIPGRGLYYTVYSVVISDSEGFSKFGTLTLDTALGMAIGFVLVAIAVRYIRRIKMYLKNKNAKLEN